MNYKLFFWAVLLLAACNQTPTKTTTATDADYLHQAEKKLTDIIITDIFSPPVASRIYAYCMLAAYEAGRFSQESANVKQETKNLKPIPPSVVGQLKGFGAMPVPEQGQTYDFTIAAIKALCTTAPKVIFSVKDMADFEEKTLSELKERCSEEVFNRSVAFGEAVAAVMIKRIGSDNYKETRGMERFEVKNNVGRWVPTPPDYADGVEPHWGKMKAMVMDSAGHIRAAVPAPYSEDKNSEFWKETIEVQQVSKTITPEQEDIVTFWDDNPFVSRHKGHLMFQDKKMTPGGHWMAICQLFLKERKADFPTSLKAYALTSLSLYEAFISCWYEKYLSVRVRPETVISAKLEKEWHPMLVTPPFPAYTSGHSTISAAAAEVLTALFGDNQAFTDTTEKEYGLPVRSFTSFRQAAKEASESRILGGIHFRSDCEKGNEQGVKVGQLVLQRLKF
jgi:PAP2 superfamily